MASAHTPRQNASVRNRRSNENFARVDRRDTLSGADAVQLIKRLWGDTLDKNLAVAKIVVSLQAKYVTKGNFDEFGFPFGYSWFRKMVKIGKHPGINDPEYREMLPDARRTLYQISLLGRNAVTGHDLFLEACEQGIIHRHTTAKEVEQWRKRKTVCHSDLLINLTIAEKKKLDATEDKQDPEMLDQIISVFCRYADTAGYRVKVTEIISERKDETRKTNMKARKSRTPAGVKKLRESMQGRETYAMRRSVSGEWDCQKDCGNGPMHLPLGKPSRNLTEES